MYLDADAAGHMAVAVHRHREVLNRLGRACPPELPELEDILAGIAQGGPGRPQTASAVNGATVRGMDHDWLTPDETAVVSGLSPRTIRRRIPSSKIGRSRRISRTDLEQFMRAAT